MPDRQETFSRLPLFAALQPAEREQVAAMAGERSFAAGETLFYEGSPCEGLYILASGAAKIVKTSSSGREIMLAVDRAPATVAEVPLFDGGPYPATVVAIEDVNAYVLHKDDFRRFCREHPDVALKMLAVVGRRLRILVSLVESVTFGSVRQRLARALIEFMEVAGSEEFVLPVTHEELAFRLGTVREVVSRNLGRFQAEGILRLNKRDVVVLDAAALRAEAETEY
ncbi:MAG: Crp/Fnr family transcriptional regulator [Bryobacterales bacterium]|nr:Crp/Fnr family transcriptional regulator [Bryobacterales bacterium]